MSLSSGSFIRSSRGVRYSFIACCFPVVPLLEVVEEYVIVLLHVTFQCSFIRSSRGVRYSFIACHFPVVLLLEVVEESTL